MTVLYQQFSEWERLFCSPEPIPDSGAINDCPEKDYSFNTYPKTTVLASIVITEPLSFFSPQNHYCLAYLYKF